VLFAGQNIGNDITVHPLSIAYQSNRPISGGELGQSLTLVQNIPGGDRGGSDDFLRNRAGAKAAYTLLRFGMSLSHLFGEQWQGRALLNGQYTRDALVPGEQFGIGGSTSVRGMDERVLATDSGLALNLELYTPNLCPSHPSWQCRALGFVDAATGRRNKSWAGEVSSTSANSTGLGLRVDMGSSASLQVDYGHVLHAGAATGDRNKLHVRMGFAY
jgi:hemolysin activation/secretion protein